MDCSPQRVGHDLATEQQQQVSDVAMQRKMNNSKMWSREMGSRRWGWTGRLAPRDTQNPRLRIFSLLVSKPHWPNETFSAG